jgi:hypothetical protein
MSTSDFTTTILLDASAAVVFDAINNVRGWWSEEIEGSTSQLHDVFWYHHQEVHYCKLQIVEFDPGKLVTWLVLENQFSFTQDPSEWKGNRLQFEITELGEQTQLRFTQYGLVPSNECYAICDECWVNYIHNSLRNLVLTGKGEPNPKEDSGFNAEIVKKWNLRPESVA